MHWYEGGITDAITASKRKGAIFVVYVEGKDDTSAQISSFIESEEVRKKLENDNFVAIKVEGDSLSHHQFKEIFSQATVPSLFFIGKNGVPLDVIMEANNEAELSLKIDVVLQKAGFTNSDVSKAATGSQELINHEQSAMPPNVVCENGVCTVQKKESPTLPETKSPILQTNESPTLEKHESPTVQKGDSVELKKEKTPNTNVTPEPTTSSTLSPEEKLERAKELLEMQRLQKQKEEEEKERQKEIERRKVGQNVQNLKRWQKDQELKELKEEREKEKRENQAARDRVLAQIAQDKAERAARFSSSPQPSPASSAVPSSPKSNSSNSNMARLQFKFPDGTSHTRDFPSSESLMEVYSYIRDNFNLSSTKFALSTTFPRREFDDRDYTLSLLELQLVPNAVILVLPISSHGTVSTQQGSMLSSLFWSLIAPFFNMFGYIKSIIFGSKPAPKANKRSAEPSDDASRPVPPKRMSTESTVVRRQGNIHRLSNRKDSDDENNTWNGNSTQQM